MSDPRSKSDAWKLLIAGAVILCAAGLSLPIVLSLKIERDTLEKALIASGTCVLAGLTVLYLGIREWRNPRPTTIPTAIPAPEIWDQSQSTVFDAGGMQFRVTPYVESRNFMVLLEFLNRYQGAAQLTVWLTAYRGIRREILLECPGGAGGISRFAIAIPREQQGGVVYFQMAARSVYPAGKGDWIRPMTGIAVGAPIGTLAIVGTVLGHVFLPVMVHRVPPRLEWKVPDGVNDVVHESDVQTKIVSERL